MINYRVDYHLQDEDLRYFVVADQWGFETNVTIAKFVDPALAHNFIVWQEDEDDKRT